MANKKQVKKSGTPPDIRCKSGVFGLSAWKTQKVIPAKHDYDIERVFDRVSICLTVGMKRDGKWENRQAWFRLSQFGDLRAAVEGFADELQKLNGTQGGGLE